MSVSHITFILLSLPLNISFQNLTTQRMSESSQAAVTKYLNKISGFFTVLEARKCKTKGRQRSVLGERSLPGL